MKLDKIDRKILQILQDDSSLPLEKIALQVNLTPTPAWRRIQRLEQTGVIERREALCNAEQLGVGVTVFVAIKTEQHNAQWLDKFARGVRDIPEVLELHRMSGDIDYLLKVVTPDIRSYDTVYKKLIKVADLSDVSSSFSMERIKYTTALPVDYAE
ncbi:MAG: Lrp/AsnC family transcriptional regulator [Burkholderiales bacterium]